jgi:5-formyltetrahydrofolate cyclo-ligase
MSKLSVEALSKTEVLFPKSSLQYSHPMDPRSEKTLLLKRTRERLDHLSSNERAAESRTLCRELLKVLPASPCTIAAYMALPSEPDLALLFDHAAGRGDVLFLPCYNAQTHVMVFRRWHHGDPLVHSALNIPEPVPAAEELHVQNLDVVLVPGRAFDRAGNRLGRGNGGYDRWIAALRAVNPRTQVWGVAFECQWVQLVPTEPHDQKVDAIITARGITKPMQTL